MKRFNPFCSSSTVRWRIKRPVILVYLLVIMTAAVAQRPVPRNLVFEGSGIRGIAFAGAIQEFERQNMIYTVQRVSGTSAGAITALLLSLGYSAAE